MAETSPSLAPAEQQFDFLPRDVRGSLLELPEAHVVRDLGDLARMGLAVTVKAAVDAEPATRGGGVLVVPGTQALVAKPIGKHRKPTSIVDEKPKDMVYLPVHASNETRDNRRKAAAAPAIDRVIGIGRTIDALEGEYLTGRVMAASEIPPVPRMQRFTRATNRVARGSAAVAKSAVQQLGAAAPAVIPVIRDEIVLTGRELTAAVREGAAERAAVRAQAKRDREQTLRPSEVRAIYDKQASIQQRPSGKHTKVEASLPTDVSLVKAGDYDESFMPTDVHNNPIKLKRDTDGPDHEADLEDTRTVAKAEKITGSRYGPDDVLYVREPTLRERIGDLKEAIMDPRTTILAYELKRQGRKLQNKYGDDLPRLTGTQQEERLAYVDYLLSDEAGPDRYTILEATTGHHGVKAKVEQGRRYYEQAAELGKRVLRATVVGVTDPLIPVLAADQAWTRHRQAAKARRLEHEYGRTPDGRAYGELSVVEQRERESHLAALREAAAFDELEVQLGRTVTTARAKHNVQQTIRQAKTLGGVVVSSADQAWTRHRQAAKARRLEHEYGSMISERPYSELSDKERRAWEDQLAIFEAVEEMLGKVPGESAQRLGVRQAKALGSIVVRAAEKLGFVEIPTIEQQLALTN